jgi:hypothetical protein
MAKPIGFFRGTIGFKIKPIGLAILKDESISRPICISTFCIPVFLLSIFSDYES